VAWDEEADRQSPAPIPRIAAGCRGGVLGGVLLGLPVVVLRLPLLVLYEERREFIEQFWLRRDPTPGTVENEFKEEHYRRIAYANERFASRIPGWKTDRGRIYITFGPPDEIEFSARPTPAENWRYRRLTGLGNDVTIAFTDPSGTGEFRMASDQTDLDQLRNRPSIPTLLPMRVQVDYMRIAWSSTMANITVQFE
jgi:GWxTD domain-containing protein